MATAQYDPMLMINGVMDHFKPSGLYERSLDRVMDPEHFSAIKLKAIQDGVHIHEAFHSVLDAGLGVVE